MTIDLKQAVDKISTFETKASYDEVVRLNIKLQRELDHVRDRNSALSKRVEKRENRENIVYLLMLFAAMASGFCYHAYMIPWLKGEI